MLNTNSFWNENIHDLGAFKFVVGMCVVGAFAILAIGRNRMNIMLSASLIVGAILLLMRGMQISQCMDAAVANGNDPSKCIQRGMSL